jgi:plastocyanin
MKLTGVTRLAILTCGTMATLGLMVFVAYGGLSVDTASAQVQEPRNLRVLAGAGQDTVMVTAFFPQNIRIRAGDTLTWRNESDQDHVVGFTQGSTPPGPLTSNLFAAPGEVLPAANVPVPGRPGDRMNNPARGFPNVESGATYSGNTFVSSGRLQRDRDWQGVPVPDSFSLTFDTPGTYAYLCLVHPEGMFGTVEVVASSAADIPSQAEIDAVAQAEMGLLLGPIERVRGVQGASVQNEPGPNNSQFWYVRAGNASQGGLDERAHILEFLPRDVTITAGDTVIWRALSLHTATFVPSPPAPAVFLPEAQPDGSPWMVQNHLYLERTKPAGVFNPAQYFNSGPLNSPNAGSTAWALTFETPGTFEYICLVHQELGMKGMITVLPRPS